MYVIYVDQEKHAHQYSLINRIWSPYLMLAARHKAVFYLGKIIY